MGKVGMCPSSSSVADTSAEQKCVLKRVRQNVRGQQYQTSSCDQQYAMNGVGSSVDGLPGVLT